MKIREGKGIWKGSERERRRGKERKRWKGRKKRVVMKGRKGGKGEGKCFWGTEGRKGTGRDCRNFREG